MDKEAAARKVKLRQEEKCYSCKSTDCLTTHNKAAKEGKMKLYLVPCPNKPAKRIPRRRKNPKNEVVEAKTMQEETSTVTVNCTGINREGTDRNSQPAHFYRNMSTWVTVMDDGSDDTDYNP
jgi:hypothetical protein